MNVTIAPSFVPNPSGRGTLGLLWECLFTYFLCLWTVVHPACRPSTDLLFWTDTSKVSWCCLIFFLPEIAILWVVREYVTAREVCRRVNTKLWKDQDGESASQLAMDESSVDLTPLASSPSQSAPETRHQPDCPISQKILGSEPRWGLAHSYLVQRGALKFKLDKAEQFPTLVGIQQLAQCNMLPSVSFLDTKIKALQKSDKLAKTLVCLQVSWLVIQAIARRIENLPVTLLELNTIAQVWIALVIYGLWWFKPQGIVEVILIDFGHCKGRKQLHENGIPSPDSSFASTPPDYSHDSDIHLAVGILLILGVVYVAIDALGWTAYFPTHEEMVVWQASICILAVGTMFTLVRTFTTLVEAPTWGEDLLAACALLFGLVGRVLLTVEAFISIRSLPIGSYSTPSWSGSIPHIG